MVRDSDSYVRAIRQVSEFIQLLIYRRETHPIKDRDEVNEDLGKRVSQIAKYARNGKSEWRKGLLELAAYAIFAAVSDE
jgi:hypothetical protein